MSRTPVHVSHNLQKLLLRLKQTKVTTLDVTMCHECDARGHPWVPGGWTLRGHQFTLGATAPPVPKTIQMRGCSSPSCLSASTCVVAQGVKKSSSPSQQATMLSILVNYLTGPHTSVPILWMRSEHARTFSILPAPGSGCLSCLL